MITRSNQLMICKPQGLLSHYLLQYAHPTLMTLHTEQLLLVMVVINTPYCCHYKKINDLPPSRSYNLPVVSQTQEDYDDISVFEGYDNKDVPITLATEGSCHNSIAAHLNSVFDDTDDFLSTMLLSILDHRYFTGILEYKLQYSNGDIPQYPLDLVKDEGHACAKYIVSNSLVLISNIIHRCQARILIRSLKRTVRRLRYTGYLGFDLASYNPSPKRRHSRHYAPNTSTSSVVSLEITKSKSKRSLKFWFKVPKNCKYILLTDEDVGNTMSQDCVEKEVSSLIHHEQFDFKCPTYKPLGDC